MKTRIGIITGFLALSVLLLLSCEDWGWDCIKGNGDLTTENRVVDDFTSLEVNGSLDVYIDQGSNTNVVVEADENLQRHIETYVRGDKLIIETNRDKCLRSSNQIAIYVTTPGLTAIDLNGSGNIDCGALNTPSLDVELDGSGSIYLSNVVADETKLYIAGSGYMESTVDVLSVEARVDGSGEIMLNGFTQTSDLIVTGSGRIRANKLETDDCYITISGSGDVYTLVFDLLDVNISGSGSVYYYGDPQEINKHISGSGSVIKRNN